MIQNCKNMKIRNIILIAGLLLMISSCRDEFLTEHPDFLSPDNFYQTEADALAGLNAVYDGIKGHYNYGWEHFLYGFNVMGVNAVATEVASAHEEGWGIPDELAWTASTQKYVLEMWADCYMVINRANVCITGTEGITKIDAKKKARIIAEAKYIRALMYFTLIRFYGNIPVITLAGSNPNLTNVNTTEAVYALIETDLKEGIENLPYSYSATSDIGRITKGAAQTLLAKVYLQNKQWDKAAAMAKTVIDEGKYKLYAGKNYDFNFRADHENEIGWERIFEIQYTKGINEGSLFGAFTGPADNRPGGDDWETIHATDYFYKSWENGDLRKKFTLIDKYYNYAIKDTVFYPDDQYMQWTLCAKYVEYDRKSTTDGERNFVMLRYSDVLLMYSEAVNMMSFSPADQAPAEAYTGINQVRQRAGLAPLSGLTREGLRQALIRERQWELCFEGHEFFDEVRQGVLAERNKLTGITFLDEHHNLLPIPQSEIDLNPNLKQNTGW